jgi:hypothetical protein
MFELSSAHQFIGVLSTAQRHRVKHAQQEGVQLTKPGNEVGIAENGKVVIGRMPF